ncbi:MAG: hypothetical protein R3E12_13995 [Candidatus Eisenbacteria bacterium]
MTNRLLSPRNALLSAGSFVALMFLFAVAKELVFPAAMERAMGVLFGLYFVIFGNVLPKSSSSEGLCRPSRRQATLRFSGWIFVLMGLAYATVWIVLPIEQASRLTFWILLPAGLLVLGRSLWVFTSCRSARQDGTTESLAAVDVSRR